MFEKEPETIEWLDSFSEGDVLFDIGANVGMYTVYAGLMGKVSKIYAFEPESQNYALLNENVYINGLAEMVTCLNVALADVNKLDRMYLSVFSQGEACHNFGAPLDFNKQRIDSPFSQGIISYTLDSFIDTFSPDFPNHIKIDVDGIEAAIIEGAKKTLADPRMKTIQIELNDKLEEDMRLLETISSLGFSMKWKRHAPTYEGTEFEYIYNYVFEKKQVKET